MFLARFVNELGPGNGKKRTLLTGKPSKSDTNLPRETKQPNSRLLIPAVRCIAREDATHILAQNQNEKGKAWRGEIDDE